jgi:hypothetical protein
LEWVILTGGVVWQVYHVTGGLPIVVDLVLEVDLFGEDMLVQNANELCVLKIVATAIRKELKRTTRQSITQLKF